MRMPAEGAGYCHDRCLRRLQLCQEKGRDAVRTPQTHHRSRSPPTSEDQTEPKMSSTSRQPSRTSANSPSSDQYQCEKPDSKPSPTIPAGVTARLFQQHLRSADSGAAKSQRPLPYLRHAGSQRPASAPSAARPAPSTSMAPPLISPLRTTTRWRSRPRRARSGSSASGSTAIGVHPCRSRGPHGSRGACQRHPGWPTLAADARPAAHRGSGPTVASARAGL